MAYLYQRSDMTLIVGIEQGGVAYMAADSGGWADGLEDSNAEAKIFSNGPALIGLSGGLRTANVLKWFMPVLPALECDPAEYVNKQIIPLMRDALREHGALSPKAESVTEEWDGGGLVAVGGQIFRISLAFCAFRNTRGYVYSGHNVAGGIAYGVLTSTRGRDPIERLRLALEAAEDHTDAVRRPFQFVTSAASPSLAAVA